MVRVLDVAAERHVVELVARLVDLVEDSQWNAQCTHRVPDADALDVRVVGVFRAKVLSARILRVNVIPIEVECLAD
jgi:hypothetical protein